MIASQSAAIVRSEFEFDLRSGPTTHRLIIGDARKVSPKAIGPVHLVLTSPPYWAIKDYGQRSQIGFGQNLNEYIASLCLVWRNCYEALVPGGRLVVNIGDQYLRGGATSTYQIIPLHAFVVNAIMDDAKMQFTYLGSIIWRKVSTTQTTGGASVMGSYPYPRNVYPCFENEYIAIFRKPGTPDRPPSWAKEASRLTKDEWREYTRGIWSFPGARHDENPAAFPEELPTRGIRMFSFPGETVLDPFVGSGTTMRAAAKEGRNSIGIELGFESASGRDFSQVIEERVVDVERRPFAGMPVFTKKRA